MTFSSEEEEEEEEDEEEEDEEGEGNISMWLTSVFLSAVVSKESDID